MLEQTLRELLTRCFSLPISLGPALTIVLYCHAPYISRRIVDAVRASGLSGGSQNALNQVFDKTIEDELDLMDDDPFFRKGKSKVRHQCR